MVGEPTTQPQGDKVPKKASLGRSVAISSVIVAWAVFSFIAAVFAVYGIYALLAWFGVNVETINNSLLTTIETALMWVVTLLIALVVPYLVLGHKVTRRDIGLHRLPTWSEIGLAPAGYIVSTIAAGVAIYFISQLFTGFEVNETQDIGFSNLVFRYEYFVAFITLVIIAPVVEEIFFRGYLYSKLKSQLPTWAAIIIVSLLFGLAHGQANVVVMTFIMSIFLCLMRDLTGSLWPAIIMHMIRNGIAFFILFIAPNVFINGLGG